VPLSSRFFVSQPIPLRKRRTRLGIDDLPACIQVSLGCIPYNGNTYAFTNR
jgi:hypothetical protein